MFMLCKIISPEYQRAAFEGPSAYAPAAYPSVHQLNPFAAFAAKKQ